MPNNTGDSCATCFFFEKQVEYDSAIGRTEVQVCRRVAPKILLNKSGSPVSFWPRVAADDWCGDLLTNYPNVFDWQFFDPPGTDITRLVFPGFGSWTSAFAIGDAALRFAVFGKFVLYHYSFQIGINNTGGTSIILKLPLKPARGAPLYSDTTVSPGHPGSPVPSARLAGIVNPVTQTATYTRYNGAYPGGDGVTFRLSGMYEFS